MKLSNPQRVILEKAKSYPVIRANEGFHFTNGETAHAGVVSRLIDKGALKPNMDGLFGTAQTYSPSHEA